MLRKISLLVACAGGAGLAGAGACGGDDGGNPDARHTDAAPDGGADAPPEVRAGTLSVLEAQVLVSNGSGGAVPFGSGLSVRMAIVDPTELGAPVIDTTGGTNFGCKVYEYTPAQLAASIGHDLGTMAITAGDGTPAIPTCGFQPGAGYLCPEPTTASAGDNAAVAAIGGGLFALTDDDVTYTAAVVGRYVSITGATEAANNGQFPIVSLSPPSTIVYANPAGVSGTLGGSHITIAGLGPIPQAAPGTFVEDDDNLAFAFSSSDEALIPSFTGNIADTANHFTLSATSIQHLLAPPLDGTAFSLDCPDVASCGDAIASVLNIQTTDANVTGLSPFAMPTPTGKAVLARCTSTPGLGSVVDIPAEVSAHLMTSGATRIQSTFVRAQLVLTTTPPVGAKFTIIGGTSQVGFYTVLPAFAPR